MPRTRIQKNTRITCYPGFFASKFWLALVFLGSALPIFAGPYTAKVPGVKDDEFAVISVKRIWPSPGKGKPDYPCHAAIGDEIELQVMNLDLWIERILTQRGTPSAKKGEALIASVMPNLCLVLDGQPMFTIRISSWYHTDWLKDEEKAKDELRELQQKKKHDLEQELAGKEWTEVYWFSVNWKKLGWQLMSGCCFGYV
jgi:hypothetical protein